MVNKKFPDLQDDEVWIGTVIRTKDGKLTTRLKVRDPDYAAIAQDFYDVAIAYGYEADKKYLVKLREKLNLKTTLNEIADLLKLLAKQ